MARCHLLDGQPTADLDEGTLTVNGIKRSGRCSRRSSLVNSGESLVNKAVLLRSDLKSNFFGEL